MAGRGSTRGAARRSRCRRRAPGHQPRRAGGEAWPTKEHRGALNKAALTSGGGAPDPPRLSTMASCSGTEGALVCRARPRRSAPACRRTCRGSWARGHGEGARERERAARRGRTWPSDLCAKEGRGGHRALSSKTESNGKARRGEQRRVAEGARVRKRARRRCASDANGSAWRAALATGGSRVLNHLSCANQRSGRGRGPRIQVLPNGEGSTADEGSNKD